MGISYEVYLDTGASIVLNICTQTKIVEEEKKAVISAFCDELSNRMFDTKCAEKPDAAIYGALVRSVDSQITASLIKKEMSSSEYEFAMNLYRRQIAYFDLFEKHKWQLPMCANLDLNKCALTFEYLKNAGVLRKRIIETDNQITVQLKRAEETLDKSICDHIKDLCYDLAKYIEVCKKQGIQIPNIHNYDSDDTLKSLRQIEQRIKRINTGEMICKRMLGRSEKIEATLDQAESEMSLELCKEATLLINEQKEDINRCREQEIDIDKLPIISPDEEEIRASRLKSYIQEMNEVYDQIRDNDNALQVLTKGGKAHRGQWKRIAALCRNQIDNVNICRYRNWIVPDIKCRDYQELYTGYSIWTEMDDLEVRITEEIKNAAEEDRVRIAQMCDELEKKLKLCNSDWKHPVINRERINEIRRDITALRSKKHNKIVRWVAAGAGMFIVLFIMIGGISLFNSTSKSEKVVKESNPSINRIDSSLGESIKIGNTNADFVGENVDSVVSSLSRKGFSNIKKEAVNSGWAKGATVLEVLIDNRTNYRADSQYSNKVNIVVKYSSDDRVDVSTIMSNSANKKDYSNMRKALEGKGILNIEYIISNTSDVSKNQTIKEITIDGKEYVSGDCFLRKESKLSIEYYYLRSEIGKTANDIVKKDYREIKAELESKGFSNVQFQKSNDLITGWVNKEETIKSITINGTSEFAESDVFDYNVPIVITVNTYKNKEYPDIP